jgi:hypothetical protein
VKRDSDSYTHVAPLQLQAVSACRVYTTLFDCVSADALLLLLQVVLSKESRKTPRDMIHRERDYSRRSSGPRGGSTMGAAAWGRGGRRLQVYGLAALAGFLLAVPSAFLYGPGVTHACCVLANDSADLHPPLCSGK